MWALEVRWDAKTLQSAATAWSMCQFVISRSCVPLNLYSQRQNNSVSSALKERKRVLCMRAMHRKECVFRVVEGGWDAMEEGVEGKGREWIWRDGVDGKQCGGMWWMDVKGCGGMKRDVEG